MDTDMSSKFCTVTLHEALSLLMRNLHPQGRVFRHVTHFEILRSAL